MKIFVGPREISNVCALLAMGLRERGFHVTAVADDGLRYYESYHYNQVLRLQDRTKAIRIAMRLWFFISNCFHQDAFVFLYGRSLLPFNLDLPILRFLGKTTAMWFLGSEVRDSALVQAEVARMGIKYEAPEADEVPGSREKRTRLVRRVEKHVDHIICGPSNAQLLARPYFGSDLQSRVFLPLDVGNISYSNVGNDPPLIVHAPTNRRMKGTPSILAVVEQLKDKGRDFNFRLLTNISNSAVRQRLSEADIAIDQLFAAGPGMFALEAMAAGCAVLGGNIPVFAGYPKELPIVHTDRRNLYQNLKRLLDSRMLRQELGERGRAYVEKYHDYKVVAATVADILTGVKAVQRVAH
jgi:hypothetical protein